MIDNNILKILDVIEELSIILPTSIITAEQYQDGADEILIDCEIWIGNQRINKSTIISCMEIQKLKINSHEIAQALANDFMFATIDEVFAMELN